eukprot:TRINITY_DN20136_c0_g1_i2.p2 TRINITY_DN20136_c0_g1~~TRINITY_DN20136_c0_g1_i2.p2  ORF type:complete len:170 (-),score=45.83 TRINITY_DN20136_c0_g1_i2:369-878(-)
MNRLWRGEAEARYDSLLSIDEVFQLLPDDLSDDSLCLKGEVYGVYSKLHSEGRKCEIKTHSSKGFAYILATQPQSTDARFERVIPLPATFSGLDMKTLRSFFAGDGEEEEEVSSIVLGFVDADGTAVLNRFHLGIFGPHPKQLDEKETDEQQEEEKQVQPHTAASDEET